jgi:hypothetical protein
MRKVGLATGVVPANSRCMPGVQACVVVRVQRIIVGATNAGSWDGTGLFPSAMQYVPIKTIEPSECGCIFPAAHA